MLYVKENVEKLELFKENVVKQLWQTRSLSVNV